MEIELYGKGIPHKCLIDEENSDLINKYRWNVHYNKKSKNYYLTGALKKENKYVFVQFHRLIMNCPHNLVVDHINHDTLDNRKINLRIITRGQNQQNRLGPQKNNKLGIRGVCFIKSTNKYRAYVKINHEKIILGEFDDVGDANLAVIEGRKKYLPYSIN